MPRAIGMAASAGEREFYITLQQLTEGTANSNFPTESWTQLGKVWASRDYVTLDERATADQLSATAVVEWDIPYSVSMDPDLVDVAKKRRLVYKDRVYDVLSGRLGSRAQGRSIVLETLAKV